MHIKDNLINFLYDKNYFINIYEEYIHVFNYVELISLASNKIILKLEKFKLIINGQELFITKMIPNEILTKGTINSVELLYE